MNNSCVTGKRVYFNEKLAEEALIQFHIRNHLSENNNQGPINVYHCNDCGNWHFTSKGEKNRIFSDKKVLARIKEERLAYAWEQKLR